MNEPPVEVRIISCHTKRPLVDWSELWTFREVFLLLTWRSVRARYRQTYLGMLWAVIQPVVSLAVYSVVFGRLVGVPSEGVPYPLFVLCGIALWSLISRSVLAMTNSILSDEDLVKRVYFPRLAIPVSALAASFSHTFFAVVLLIGALFYYGVRPPLAVLFAPVFLLMTVGFVLGLGLLLAALNVQFRDVGHAMPFVIQTLLFLTPVIYPATLLPERWQLVHALNPAVGAIGGLRWSVLGVPADWPVIAISAVTTGCFLFVGLWVFSRREDTFADVI